MIPSESSDAMLFVDAGEFGSCSRARAHAEWKALEIAPTAGTYALIISLINWNRCAPPPPLSLSVFLCLSFSSLLSSSRSSIRGELVDSREVLNERRLLSVSLFIPRK
jgi:hypothetical protein